MISTICAPLAIAMPTRYMPSPQTMAALRENTGPHRLLIERGKPVDEARNTLAAAILALDPVPEFAVWLDDDAWFEPGTVEMLVATLQARPDLALLAGAFCGRFPDAPCAAARSITGHFSTLLRPRPPGVAGGNCTLGDIVSIEACGFHACAVRTSALRALGPDPFTPDAEMGLSEDYAFCKRLRDGGFEIACATGVTFLHVEQESGFAYAPDRDWVKIANNRARAVTDKDIATRIEISMWTSVFTGEAPRLGILSEARSYGPSVNAIRAAAIGIPLRSATVPVDEFESRARLRAY